MTGSQDETFENGSTTRQITIEELEKHNKTSDAWIAISGKVYEITEWMNNHPGGSEPLLLFAGRDSTEIFESYHKLSTVKMLGTAKVPLIGNLATTRFPLYTKPTQFYPVLRQKVEDKLKEIGAPSQRSLSTFNIWNTVFIFVGWVISYYMSMYTHSSFVSKFVWAVASGVFHNLAMVHVLHDISHFAYGSSHVVWRVGSYIGDILSGHSMYIWAHRHIVAHHVYTNVSGVDPDIGIYKASPHRPPAEFQYRTKIAVVPTWFQPFLYLFVVAQMQIDDLYSYTRGSMENTKINDVGVSRSIEFYTAKVFYYIHRIILPIYLGFGVFNTLYFFMVCEATAGLLFGYFSQVTHVSDDAYWPKEGPIERDWAELQVETAIDFSHDSYLWTYMSGFLNYQIVHHLFPGMAPHYYPVVLQTCKDVCKEFNVKYTVYDTLTETIKHHFDHLKTFQKYRERHALKLAQNKVDPKDMHIVDKMDLWFKGFFGGSKVKAQ
jgi:fatty acid desaturase/predicted heme/steroid binding protein